MKLVDRVWKDTCNGCWHIYTLIGRLVRSSCSNEHLFLRNSNRKCEGNFMKRLFFCFVFIPEGAQLSKTSSSSQLLQPYRINTGNKVENTVGLDNVPITFVQTRHSTDIISLENVNEILSKIETRWTCTSFVVLTNFISRTSQLNGCFYATRR